MLTIIMLSIIMILLLFKMRLNHKMLQKLHNHESNISKLERQEDILELIINMILFTFVLTGLAQSSLPIGLFIFALITSLAFIGIKLFELFNKQQHHRSLVLIELIIIILLTISYLIPLIFALCK